jgi:tetratricopeptide (TPR) repeat protein
MWAEAYQTVLSGMYDVQSKVATEVANALNLTLLAPERQALDAKPTESRQAYSLYVRGRYILDNSFQVGPVREAITVLQRATALDPGFALAWAYLAVAHTELYWFGGDPTQDRLTRARAALERAMALDPDAADVHLARGAYLYQGERDYDGALREFAATRTMRPSDPNVPLYEGAVQRRQGKWNEAIDSYMRAIELDPRLGGNILDLANTLVFLNRYQEAETYVDQGMILTPAEAMGPRLKSTIAINARGNVPEAIEHMRNAVQTVQPPSALTSLLLSEPWPAVEDRSLRKILLDAAYSRDMNRGAFYTSKATVMLYLGDMTSARSYADSAVAALDKDIRSVAEPSTMYLNLSTAHSILGHPREALEAFARAEEVLPASMDAFSAGSRQNACIMILTNLGDYEGAISQMEKRVDIPGGVTRNYLRLNPLFAPMRANPRFQRLALER